MQEKERPMHNVLAAILSNCLLLVGAAIAGAIDNDNFQGPTTFVGHMDTTGQSPHSADFYDDGRPTLNVRFNVNEVVPSAQQIFALALDDTSTTGWMATAAPEPDLKVHQHHWGHDEAGDRLTDAFDLIRIEQMNKLGPTATKEWTWDGTGAEHHTRPYAVQPYIAASVTELEVALMHIRASVLADKWLHATISQDELFGMRRENGASMQRSLFEVEAALVHSHKSAGEQNTTEWPMGANDHLFRWQSLDPLEGVEGNHSEPHLSIRRDLHADLLLALTKTRAFNEESLPANLRCPIPCPRGLCPPTQTNLIPEEQFAKTPRCPKPIPPPCPKGLCPPMTGTIVIGYDGNPEMPSPTYFYDWSEAQGLAPRTRIRALPWLGENARE